VGDLDPDVGETTLFEVFNVVAPVATIRVCRNAVTRQSLGYAYVNFQSPADAEKAVNELNYTPIRGRPCRIMWSQRDPAMRRSNVGNIFIKNLASEIVSPLPPLRLSTNTPSLQTSRELHATFKLFGNILSCKVATDAKTGKSKVSFTAIFSLTSSTGSWASFVCAGLRLRALRDGGGGQEGHCGCGRHALRLPARGGAGRRRAPC
jgi:hypothetical protein